MESQITETSSEYSTMNLLIIKGRFKSPSIYGQFIIVFNNAKNVETHNIVASTYSDAYKLEPHAEWYLCEEFIADLKWKGNYNSGLTVSLMSHLQNYIEDYNSLEILYRHAYDYDYDNLEIVLSDQINRIIHDKNLMIETVIQEVTPEEYSKIRESRNKPKEAPVQKDNEKERLNLPSDAIIIEGKPILAPVKGKPLYAIKIGDKIMLNIKPNTDRTNYVIDLLDLRTEDGVRPVPGKVIDIKAGSTRKDPITVLTEISPNIYVKFFEDQHQVKLKLYDPSEYEPAEQNPYASSGQKGLSRGTVIMTSLFIIIISIFIFFMILSWI